MIPQATAATNGTPVLALATLHPVRVYADLPQPDTPYVKDGDAATIRVAQYPRRNFTGVVSRHPEALSPDTRTMLVEVDLPNDDTALLPGMYGSMQLRVARPDVPRVPDDALVFRDGKVFVPIVRDNRVRLAEASLGYDDGREVEVVEGVSGDDVVALNVGQGVADGDAVQPVRAKEDAVASKSERP